jgi:tripartite-type tricarboxylate transporter receptor subunit TctC
MEKLAREAGLAMVHVPYQGFGPAQTDLMAGRIGLMLDAPGNALPLISAGKLKAIAVTGSNRLTELPDVPTISELVPGYLHEEWFAIVAPPKTPDRIVAKLSADIAEAMAAPDVVARLTNYRVQSSTASPAQTAALLQSESKRWAQLISALHIERQTTR